MSLTLEVYSSGGTLLLPDDYHEAMGITFDGFYPGGLFGGASFFVPRKPARLGLIVPGMRVKIKNGLVTVWEGYVSARTLVTDETSSGVQYTCLGAWGYILGGVLINKPWADTRIDESNWIEQTDVAVWQAAEKCGIDRMNRIRFTPNSVRDAVGAEVGWSNGNNQAVKRTVPTGQTVKRITYNYDLQEGAQAWELGLRNEALTILEQITSSGTGATDHTLVTPDNIVYLYMASRAAQTPATDGTMYAEYSSITVYTETGSIDSTEIAKDVIPLITGCSSAETGIGSNTLSLVPFVAENITAAEVLTKAASFGDASFNSWAFCIKESDLSPDDKPILYYAQQPALASAEYYIRLDDENLQPPVNLAQDTAEVRNWISVRYSDIDGRSVVLSPDDDANLKDTTSIAAYGTRAEEIMIDTTSATLATSYGRRYLGSRKDPQWTIQGGLTVKGYIRNASGGHVPAANIKPGERVRIENFIEDISGTGLTFLITGTDYNDDAQTNSLQVGRPNRLDVWLARMTGGIGDTREPGMRS